MSKVLVVLPSAAPHPTVRLLRILGIPHEVGYLTTVLETPAGSANYNNDAAVRALLRNYTAVLVLPSLLNLGGTNSLMRAFRWLGWNNPEDPPVAYLGAYPRAGYADMGTLPSDFPILQPDPANPSDTTANYDATIFTTTAHLRVKLHRENTELYTNAANFYQTSSATAMLYRLDTTRHNALGDQGEILATPVTEDVSFPANTVLAYRYKNRYLLPTAHRGGAASAANNNPINGGFWFLYALKLMALQPAYPIPLFLVMDDALCVHHPPTGSETIQPTYAQWSRIGYETYRHLAEVLYPRSGMAMVCGLFTGGRYGRVGFGSTPAAQTTHWDLTQQNRRWTGSAYEDLDPQTAQNYQLWHNLLVQHHKGALPCTPHDHTLRHWANQSISNFQRHNDTGYAYAAPNDVPITRGSTLVKASTYPGTPPPDYRERILNGELYYEWGFSATSGTSDTIVSLTPNNYHAARLIWETAVAEMRVLGFPDAVGNGNYPMIITPFGHTGDVSVWRAQYDLGYRLTRSDLRSVHTPADTNPASSLWTHEGMHFATGVAIDMSTQFDANFGLYHPSYATRTAVGSQNLDISNDILGIWNSDRPTASRRAYRRAIGWATHQCLRTLTLHSTLMAHPYNLMTWADPNDPTRPFDPNDPDSRINFLLEIAWNMEKVVNVLSPYLKWGTVREFVQLRERVFEY